jgi:hypothetical protein
LANAAELMTDTEIKAEIERRLKEQTTYGAKISLLNLWNLHGPNGAPDVLGEVKK